MNVFVDVAEILVDHDTHDIGVRFGDGDVFVMPTRAAESLGRGLLDCAATYPPARTPAKWVQS